MVDQHRVYQSDAARERPVSRLRSLEKVILQVGVLRAQHPALVIGVVASDGLLIQISGDANAGAIACRHPERQIRPLDVELVLSLVRAFGALILIAPEDDTGEIDRNCEFWNWLGGISRRG